jgi:hypothetical protein
MDVPGKQLRPTRVEERNERKKERWVVKSGESGKGERIGKGDGGAESGGLTCTVGKREVWERARGWTIGGMGSGWLMHPLRDGAVGSEKAQINPSTLPGPLYFAGLFSFSTSKNNIIADPDLCNIIIHANSSSSKSHLLQDRKGEG